MFTKASIATLFAGLAAAQIHAPVGEPNGNPILRPLNEIVPKCEPFTIQWQPTTTNTISLLLLKGPSTNVIKHGPSLAEGIANSGSLVWTPPKDLEVTEANQGYGLQIIDDVTGQYQWSTQFGISAGSCGEEEEVASSVAAPEPAKSSAAAEEYPAEVPSETFVYHVPQSTKAAHPTVAPYPTTIAIAKSSAVVAPVGSATGVAPSGTLAPMPTSSITTFTGAASSVQAGLTFAGAVAAFALMF